MKFDNTEAEKNFASLQLGLTTYVANVFAQYEAALEEAHKQIKAKEEELTRLKESTVVEKIE